MNSDDNNDTVPFSAAVISQRPKFCHLKRNYFSGEGYEYSNICGIAAHILSQGRD